MTSVADIEIAIGKLSLAKQRTIARHLAERLADERVPTACAASDEGIRSLPPHSCWTSLGEPRIPNDPRRGAPAR
jgi:hypothetical protein